MTPAQEAQFVFALERGDQPAANDARGTGDEDFHRGVVSEYGSGRPGFSERTGSSRRKSRPARRRDSE